MSARIAATAAARWTVGAAPQRGSPAARTGDDARRVRKSGRIPRRTSDGPPVCGGPSCCSVRLDLPLRLELIEYLRLGPRRQHLIECALAITCLRLYRA